MNQLKNLIKGFTFASVPVVTLACLGSVNPVDAAVFNLGDQLNFIGTAQGTGVGTTNPAILFGLNPLDTNGGVAGVGDTGSILSSGATNIFGGSVGSAFSSVGGGTPGTIASFDTNSGVPLDFVTFPTVSIALTESVPLNIVPTTGDFVDILFDVAGTATDTATNEVQDVLVSFSAQQIAANPDGTTNPISFSGGALTIEVIPEPATILGTLLALGTGGGLLSRKRRKKENSPTATI